tara:strand:- start:5331 stop:6794 length:1464 start_codon:yes stop_codon:yes gene_type:complete
MKLVNTQTLSTISFETPEEAMEKFAELGFDKNWKFVPDDEVTETVKVEEPKPAAVYSTQVSPGQVSQLAVDRIERHQAALTEGFEAQGLKPMVHAPPVYATGTKVISTGSKRFKEFRQSYDNLPDADVALDDLRQCIEAEDRVDWDINVDQMKMDDDGMLSVDGVGRFAFEPKGLSGLFTKLRGPHVAENDSNLLFPKGFELMAAMDPDVRAHVFNRQLAKSDPDAPLVLRTRNNGDQQTVYAAVSEKYSAVDGDEIASMLQGLSAFDGAKGQLTYNPESTNISFDALWMPEDITDLAAGDVFKVGMRFRTNDSGKGSINGGGISFRNLCLNLIILDNLYVPQFQLRHIGNSAENVEAVMKDYFLRIRKGFDAFLTDWGVLSETAISKVKVWNQSFGTVTDALDWAVKHKKFGKQMADKVLVEALTKGYDFEKGNSLEDLVNAMTRAAHQGLFDEIERHQLERTAGELVPVLAASAKQNTKTFGYYA